MFRCTFFIPLDGVTLNVLLDALTKCNLHYLQTHPDTPTLYQSGVCYEREPDDREDWQSIPETLDRRSGDCEDLACWRAAELQFSGIDARAFHTMIPTVSGGPLYHIRVRVGGDVEDPSRRLGMGRGKTTAFLYGR